ncbi:MAG: NAD(P)H-binding protein [Chlorobiales bacterium]|nr:NAD(P)H-binding protein [Chlorobiales bacterium]
MKILITGGTGFIGSEAARVMVENGHEVRLLTTKVQRYECVVLPELPEVSYKVYTGDVRRYKSIEPAVQGVDAIVISHQFKGFPLERPQDQLTFMDVDARGTENLVRAAKLYNVKKIIYLSGAAVQESASASRAVQAKLLAEKTVRESGINYTILRASIVYGKGDHYLEGFWLKDLKEKGKTVIIGDGSEKAQPICNDDLAQLIYRCLTNEKSDNQLLYACGPDVFTTKEMLQLLMEVTGIRGKVVYIPAALANFSASVLGLLTTRPPITKGLIEFVRFDNTAHSGKLADQVMGMRFKGFREGLQAAYGQHAQTYV